MSVITIDLGTFCDNSIMNSLIASLQSEYKVISLTDEKNPTLPNVHKVSFRTPKYFTQDMDARLADPQTNFITWTLTHPFITYQSFKWLNDMKRLLSDVLERTRDLKAVFILYPACMMLWQLPQDLFDFVKVFVVHYAPGYPNKYVPWMFDSVLKDPDHILYKPSKRNIESTMSYFKRATTMSLLSRKEILKTFSKAHHLLCWNPKLLPFSIPPAFKGRYHHVGAISLNNIKPVEKRPHHRLKRTIFITFGSYSVQPKVIRMTETLVDYIIRDMPGHDILVLNYMGKRRFPKDRVRSRRDYIDYNDIVPSCALVIFTGSVCLQNVCLYHKVPMVFVPFLAEQYFWAKNYKHQTGVDYVDSSSLNDCTVKINLNDVITSKRVSSFLKRVSKPARVSQSIRKTI